MKRPEFTQVPLKYLPKDIINTYNIMQMVDGKGNTCIQINKGMYGLKQVAVLVFEQLATRLQAAGCTQVLGSSGMYKHHTRHTIYLSV